MAPQVHITIFLGPLGQFAGGLGHQRLTGARWARQQHAARDLRAHLWGAMGVLGLGLLVQGVFSVEGFI